MKTKLLLLLSLTAGLAVTAQTTAIPDANFEQALIDQGYDSASIDGFVTTADIVDIDILTIYNANIVSFAGIEDFKSLDTFFAVKNAIQEIDISQNSNLKYLTLLGGDLSAIDVSKNLELILLGVEGMPRLTAIDISQNLKLNSLDLTDTGLESVDISNNDK